MTKHTHTHTYTHTRAAQLWVCWPKAGACLLLIYRVSFFIWFFIFFLFFPNRYMTMNYDGSTKIKENIERVLKSSTDVLRLRTFKVSSLACSSQAQSVCVYMGGPLPAQSPWRVFIHVSLYLSFFARHFRKRWRMLMTNACACIYIYIYIYIINIYVFWGGPRRRQITRSRVSWSLFTRSTGTDPLQPSLLLNN